MIITVTLNPAIDKTALVNGKVKAGSLNRLTQTVTDAGGKGINVSKTIAMLGGKSVAAGFLGRGGSGRIIDSLDDAGIGHDFVLTEGETRTNLKVMDPDGVLTEFNEAGPEIGPDRVRELFSKMDGYNRAGNIFVFAGNVPAGVSRDIYEKMILSVNAGGGKVFFDADGELFRSGLKAVPFLIKPNDFETAQYFNEEEEMSLEKLIECGEKFLAMGIRQVVISRGKNGALFFSGDCILKAGALKVPVRSSVGAGDAMVAAMAYAEDTGMAFPDAARLAMAVSAGAVITEGTKPPDRGTVSSLESRVELTTIK